ncbi:MAG: Mur ligase family protein, partial [Planctomycetota bacterium]|nr:Mur ligase family protein [Planctomycetota bacterium]
MLPSTRDEAIEFLMRSINYERCDPGVGTDASFKLHTMHWLAKRFGDPHRDYPVIHVAGTKGKGSTATMIAEMLSHAGLRTGLYTSPHLHRLEERLAIDGTLISETQLLEVVQDLAGVVDSLQGEIDGGQFTGKMPTFFELVTMAALLFFSRCQVDAAVVEVGLGGRLDSTNVCHGDVGVITSISKDHTQQLGHTLDAIAREKAGIIKPGMRVVSGVLQSEAAEVIRKRAEELDAELYILGRDFIIEPEKTVAAKAVTSEGQASETGAAITQDARYHFQWQIPPLKSKHALTPVSNLKIALRGAHQVRNAGLAIAATQLCRELE